ncbi:MAG: permease [Vibrionaceae bacterium]
MNEWVDMLIAAAKMFLFLALELSLLFLLISGCVSWLRQRIPDEKIQKLLGGRRGKGYLIAAALGSLTPFCSCSTIPMLRGLLSAKAGFGPTLTFLFVSPLLNPIIVGLMWATFGWKVTLLYAVLAASVSIVASLLLDKWGFERYVIDESKPKETSASGGFSLRAAPVVANAACCSTSAPAITAISSVKTASCCAPAKPVAKMVCCTGESAAQSGASLNAANPQAVSGVRLACLDAWQQFKDVLPYLGLGVLIGSFIYGFVPSQWIAEHAGADNAFAIPLSAVIGIPLYIRAEAVIPLASVLLSKGMGVGAVLALIIGSAGASLTEVILLKSMFRTPMIVAFLTVILGMAVAMGYLVAAIF